jgi:hypothetical protein
MNRPADIVELAVEALEITELSPWDGRFVGKRILRDGSVLQYPNVGLWRQSVARIPATIPALYDYLSKARVRNVCLIRGAPANLSRQPTRRLIAGGDRGDHGFLDEPTRLLAIDVDGARGSWREDPEAAVHRIVQQLDEPFASASYVWFFSAMHGLQMETTEIAGKKCKRWTGKISNDKIRVRLMFITDQALTWREAASLTTIVAAASTLPLDNSICRVVQPNYICRPLWEARPGFDVLGDLPTIGYFGGGTDVATIIATETGTITSTTTATVTVPRDLERQARWAAAQGHHAVVAVHPDAITAVRAIASDGRIRQHLLAAVSHLLKASPPKDHVSFFDHSLALADQLRNLVKRHETKVLANLENAGRQWGDLEAYFAGMPDWARWLMNRPGAFTRKMVQLAFEERADANNGPSAEDIFARVANIIAPFGQMRDGTDVTLLIAPTGSRKSTEMRKAAVTYVTEHADKSVMILVPRHKLGEEQIRDLHEEHPNARFSAAIWRGRYREDPEVPGKLMCWRSDEARAVEEAMLDPSQLCKRGRGNTAVKCPHFASCGYQRQKHIEANIWLAAHENVVHSPQKAFGEIGRLMIDESPLDAFISDEVILEIADILERFVDFTGAILLTKGRAELFAALSEMKVPADPNQGAPVSIKDLPDFANASAGGSFEDAVHTSMFFNAPSNPSLLSRIEWRLKVEVDISPNMSAEQVHQRLELARGNAIIKKMGMLWDILADEDHGGGRIHLHRSERGRILRISPLRGVHEDWAVPTLLTDATGDAQLLRAIWPGLEVDMEEWQQLPQPDSVRVFQCVDRAISKYMIAPTGEGEKLETRERAARRLYAAVLGKALEYGGAPVAVITYKATREWIEKNCFVPSWLMLLHHGDVTGTNLLENVRALIVAGRPLPSAEVVTRMTEALFGEHIPERGYKLVKKAGRIPIVEDGAGNNVVQVDVWRHPNARAERVRRQATEANLIQEVGRARAGLRGDDDPLDIHIWTDTPLPELGVVEPTLWEELDAGLDGLMLASGGVWLENTAHAAQAYQGLFSREALRDARKYARFEAADPARGGGGFPNRVLYGNPPPPRTRSKVTRAKNELGGAVVRVSYQPTGAGQKPARAWTMLGPDETRAWLEQKLGTLVRFEVVKEKAGQPAGRMAAE